MRTYPQLLQVLRQAAGLTLQQADDACVAATAGTPIVFPAGRYTALETGAVTDVRIALPDLRQVAILAVVLHPHPSVLCELVDPVVAAERAALAAEAWGAPGRVLEMLADLRAGETLSGAVFLDAQRHPPRPR